MYSRSHHMIVMAPVVFASFIIYSFHSLLRIAAAFFCKSTVFSLILPCQTTFLQPHT